jgi:tellurite resistance protein TehA-like permease
VKFSHVVAVLSLVAWVWLTGVIWSWAGQLVTSATDLGPITGILSMVVVGLVWVLVIFKLATFINKKINQRSELDL